MKVWRIRLLHLYYFFLVFLLDFILDNYCYERGTVLSLAVTVTAGHVSPGVNRWNRSGIQ